MGQGLAACWMDTGSRWLPVCAGPGCRFKAIAQKARNCSTRVSRPARLFSMADADDQEEVRPVIGAGSEGCWRRRAVRCLKCLVEQIRTHFRQPPGQMQQRQQVGELCFLGAVARSQQDLCVPALTHLKVLRSPK